MTSEKVVDVALGWLRMLKQWAALVRMLQSQWRLWLVPVLSSHGGKAFSSGLGSCISPGLS